MIDHYRAQIRKSLLDSALEEERKNRRLRRLSIISALIGCIILWPINYTLFYWHIDTGGIWGLLAVIPSGVLLAVSLIVRAASSSNSIMELTPEERNLL